MAHLEGETSNTHDDLFDTLEDWNKQLSHVNLDIEGPSL